jgi:hypothetical protein
MAPFCLGNQTPRCEIDRPHPISQYVDPFANSAPLIDARDKTICNAHILGHSPIKSIWIVYTNQKNGNCIRPSNLPPPSGAGDDVLPPKERQSEGVKQFLLF